MHVNLSLTEQFCVPRYPSCTLNVAVTAEENIRVKRRILSSQIGGTVTCTSLRSGRTPRLCNLIVRSPAVPLLLYYYICIFAMNRTHSTRFECRAEETDVKGPNDGRKLGIEDATRAGLESADNVPASFSASFEEYKVHCEGLLVPTVRLGLFWLLQKL